MKNLITSPLLMLLLPHSITRSMVDIAVVVDQEADPRSHLGEGRVKPSQKLKRNAL
jgi:hypothetical protein